MSFSTIIAFCIAQILILMSILTIKKFRNYVNLLLGAILVLILLNFTYYFLYFNGIFNNYTQLIYIIRFFQVLPVPFLWFYSMAIITGSIIFRKNMLWHAIPLVIGFLFFLPMLINTLIPNLISIPLENYNKWFGLFYAELGGILYIIFSQLIFKNLFKIYGTKKNLKQCMLDFSYQHLTLLKVLSIMMNLYAIILISGGFIAFYASSTPTIFDYLDTGFLIFLSYIMIFILISIPKVIHYKYSKLAKSDKLLKYEKSNLSRNEAIQYVKEMNKWMETDKPYLDRSLSLGNLTEKLHLPGHIISEVLNGLLKQNFYDYINNYRIEEFKKLASIQENITETNLNLAFDSGFSSKTTFNNAFKKFTNQTPSQYRSSLNH